MLILALNTKYHISELKILFRGLEGNTMNTTLLELTRCYIKSNSSYRLDV